MIRLSRDTLFVQPIPEHLAKHATAGNGAKLHHLVYRKSTDVNDCQTKAGHLTALYHRSTRCCFDEGQLVTLFSSPPFPLFSTQCINGRQKNVKKTYENGVLHPLKDVGIM